MRKLMVYMLLSADGYFVDAEREYEQPKKIETTAHSCCGNH